MILVPESVTQNIRDPGTPQRRKAEGAASIGGGAPKGAAEAAARRLM